MSTSCSKEGPCEHQIVVPYKWSRVILENGHQQSVYYVTPSGRVLFNMEEVIAYLSNSRNCVCFLEDVYTLPLTKVFNFEPSLGFYQMGRPTERPDKNNNNKASSYTFAAAITAWCIQTPAVEMKAQFRAVLELLTKDEITDPYEAYLLYNSKNNSTSDLPNDPKISNRLRSFKHWLGTVNFDEMLFTRSYGVMPKILSPMQLKHLTMHLYE